MVNEQRRLSQDWQPNNKQKGLEADKIVDKHITLAWCLIWYAQWQIGTMADRIDGGYTHSGLYRYLRYHDKFALMNRIFEKNLFHDSCYTT